MANSWLRLEVRSYQRPFVRSLQTHHGIWSDRQGLIVRLRCEKSGAAGLGEIAPLPDFGSETFAEAIALCLRLPGLAPWHEMDAAIHHVSSHYPASQFGLGAAWENLTQSVLSEASPSDSSNSVTQPDFESSCSLGSRSHRQSQEPLPLCRLLPTGAAALKAWQQAYDQGDRTFKWKIGIASTEQEISMFQRLLNALPHDIQLRLDANGGLDGDKVQQWLQVCDHDRYDRIEFLEQPLPPQAVPAMQQLADRHRTPIALDESVASLAQLQQVYEAGWRGIVVIKAAIAGYPATVREFCLNHKVDGVWSSVFETAIARRAIEQQLIRALPTPPRALGFGVDHWFADSEMSDSEFDGHAWFERQQKREAATEGGGN